MSLPAREAPQSPVRGTLALLCEREPRPVAAALLPALPALPAPGEESSQDVQMWVCATAPHCCPATAMGVPPETPAWWQELPQTPGRVGTGSGTH